MKRRLRIGVLICACLGALGLDLTVAAAPASAATRVLGLHVDGDKVSAEDRADLFAALQSKLRLYPDVELQNPPRGELTDEMIDLECVDLDTDCLTRLGKKYQADRVVHVDVKPRGAKHNMRVRFVDVAEGKLFREKLVKADKVAELGPALELEIEAVFGAPPPPVVPGTLVIDVDSPDAVIQLGQDYMGTGTATRELPPGEYTVRITQVGFEPITRTLTVTSGQTTQERFSMTPVVVEKPPPPDDDDSEWVIWAIVGAVVVGGAVAAVAVATGGDDDAGARGPAVLSIDPTSAWRDAATVGGRR